MGRMVPVPGAVRPFLRVLIMANMKIISIMDAENRAQSATIEQDIKTILLTVEEEIDTIRANFQQQIDELKQRVAALEGVP